MVQQQFLETKAEQQNSDILSCYAVDLQTLSPYHLGTGCAFSENCSQRKKKTKKPKGLATIQKDAIHRTTALSLSLCLQMCWQQSPKPS